MSDGARVELRKPLRTLLVEDSDDDAELMLRELKRGGFDPSSMRVESADELARALEQEWDVVICDYHVPAFDTERALEMISESGHDTPTIVVSGAVDERVAVETMRAGARDFVHKDDLSRLVPAVRRELKEADSRRARRQAERALEHAQKLESIGLLAGGIAHDFNNVLTCIMGGASLSRRRARGDPELVEELDEIIAEASRAAGLVRQLLAFARRQELQKSEINLNEIVIGLDGFLRRALGSQIEIDVSLDPLLPAISADRTQIEQVLINLCLNARDAMLRGGKLRIETRRAELTVPSRTGGAELPMGSYSVLIVNDTGVGMNQEVILHLFEPFFTTKPEGRGTGLGLAVAYGIVRQHGGSIEVDSSPERGSRFHVLLPALSSASTTAAKREHDFHPPIGGVETILVVEDDPSVRAMLARTLDSYGYTVVAVDDGERAWQLFSKKPDEFQLVVLDVVLPKLGGRDLYDALKTLRPDVKVLFVSGGSDEGHEREARPTHTAELIKKPFRPDELAIGVRRALDRSRPRPQTTDVD